MMSRKNCGETFAPQRLRCENFSAHGNGARQARIRAAHLAAARAHPNRTEAMSIPAQKRMEAGRPHILARAAAGAMLCALAGLALAGTAAISRAQSPSRPAAAQEEPQRPIRVEVGLVSLFATVRDSSRRLVPALAKEDFRVYEDGAEQRLEYFSRETALPITLGMLIDTSISQQAVLALEQEAGARFLRRVLRPGDLSFVISFDLNIDLLSDHTADTEQLEAALQRARINAPVNLGPIERRGPVGTALFDAVYLACREKLAREAGRKALVILTDGVDAGSKVTLQQALETAQRSDTVIYVIGVSDPHFYGSFGTTAGGEGVARKLAEETGGRAIFVRSEKKLEAAFDEIAEELRTQYTLGYYPTNRARDGKFRKVKIETRQKGMKVLARKGYYAAREN
jgi:VWFA-related protein